MLSRIILCFAALGIAVIPAHAKGSRENGRVRCNKRGCFDIMENIDPVRRECADKVGATYNIEYRHFDGPPKVMDAWLSCVGLPPFSGPDPQRLECANQAGATFDYSTRHFKGSPEVMAAFKSCLGL